MALANQNKEISQIAGFGLSSVYVNMFGILFSGLIFPVLTIIFRPQPAWQGPELFIKSFHWIQTATFFCGYFLVLGSLLTFITLYFLANHEKKIIAFSGLVINIVFTAVVFLNYIIQTTYVPFLALNNPPEAEYLLATFSMANAGSLAWTLEMYGWGGIGLSFIFMALTFNSNKYERILRILFIVNGITSVGAAILTSVDMKWIFSPAGFSALIIWNVLVLVIDIFLIRYFRERKLLEVA